MSRILEIKTRIGSVKGTKKITRAMYLISASKSQKAKVQLESMRPYFLQIISTLSDILAAAGEIETPYIGYKTATEDKGKLYIVLAGDKGMAGGYNHNIINILNENVDKETGTLFVAGALGRNKIAREKYNIDKDFNFIVMNPNMDRARDITDIVIKEYMSNKYREINIVFTEMITPLKQEPIIVRLLPLHPEDFEKVNGMELSPSEYHIIKYEPSAGEVFDHLVPHYLTGTIYAALVEAFTSEQNARMFAMDNATKNADDMISRLTLRYNRARQAQITQEINEIVGGIPAE